MVSQTEREMEEQTDNMLFICPGITDVQRLCELDRDRQTETMGPGKHIIFYMCIFYVICFMCMGFKPVYHICAASAGRASGISCDDRSCWQLWATTWVFGMGPQASEKATSILIMVQSLQPQNHVLSKPSFLGAGEMAAHLGTYTAFALNPIWYSAPMFKDHNCP